ncbi:MAG: hypothetical protein ABT01_00040 [Clostridium sp. SCN 57-10]|nr:MAG: hypothetical protein ABT01_00040 [Clostridium sp. SCN 57-10]
MKARELISMAFLAAIAFAGQVALASLPNIEIVTLLFMLYTMVCGKRVFAVIYVFVLLEGVLYGFGLWWFSYLYVWSILAFIVLLLRRNRSVVFWAVVSGAFGLCFGALFAIPYLFSGGISAAFSYWIAGIPFDLIHCVSNAVLVLVLWKPLLTLLQNSRTLNPS